MKLSLFELIKSDLFRYHGKTGIKEFLRSIFFVKGFKFSFWLRVTKNLEKYKVLSFFPKIMYSYYKWSITTDINYRAEIGPGFCLYHVFGTTFGPSVIIGTNFTMGHNVTIGGKAGKHPTIGDNVYLGSGCCVLGGVTLGDNVVVGANAVVTKDVPDNAIVVGNPGKIISYNGSSSLIRNPIAN
jgi:serine O-acetyltransferase